MFPLVYLNWNNDVKRYKAKRYYLPTGIIKNCNVIINGKNFCDQLIDFNIKRYINEEVRNLTTGWGECYTKWCLLDYEYTKKHNIQIAVDLSSQNN